MLGVNAGAGGGGGAAFTLTIASGKVASNLTDFPVYVDLADMPAGFWSGVDADGGNIRVKQSGSVIPFDVVKIDTGGETGTLFFKAASLLTASDNIFTIDLTGGGLIAAGDPNGSEECWNAFEWVFLGEDGSTFIDRTGNGANGSLTTGSVSASAIGLSAGCGLNYVSAEVRFTGRSSSTTFTMGGTASSDIATESGHMTWLGGGDSSVTTSRYGLVVRNDSPGDNWNQWDDNNSWIAGDSGVALAANTPKRCHVVYTGTTNRKLYINGSINTTSGAITIRGSNDRHSVGCNNVGGEFFDGKVGYCYVRAAALSADYIAAEYSNLNAPSSFYSIT